ncbi:MAG: deoxyribodipyrimidine photo-lyase [Gammaproteobacteria bacterium]|nr:deoxyribodipyrimidine photo-lyase [Gammaproteobacteria bacterium]
MRNSIVIHWFRQDLRIQDNPSLREAAQQGTVLPIYILDDENAGEHRMGEASRWWLHHSLQALNKSLKGKLAVYKGNPKKILIDLVEVHNVRAVNWNRCYEPWRIARDKKIKKALEVHNTGSQSFNGSLLWEPWEILKKDGTPYKVFTPYYRKGCLSAASPKMPLPKPAKLKLYEDKTNSLLIDDLELLPTIKWDKQLETHWEIGELGAQKRLEKFTHNRLENYKQGRNFPALNTVSRLSPHLHFGEISPNQA